VQGDEALYEREPDAELTLRTVDPAVALREQLEHVRQQRGIDARPVVLDTDDRHAARGGRLHADRAAAGRVLD
jgi:hypothetical protein